MKHLPDIRDQPPHQFSGLWLHDDVERRLREACTTLRMLPMPIDGMPAGDRSNWPEIVRNAADRAGWVVGSDSPEYLRQGDADRNRVRLMATSDQIREMDECLAWLMLIRDGRYRKVVFARSHVWPDSERPMAKWPRLAREMHTSVSTLKRWYRAGIKAIAIELNSA